MAILRLPREAMVKKVEPIKRAMGWNNPIDAISIKALLKGNNDLDDQDAIMEEKMTRSSQEDVVEFSNKKRLPN